jgi:fatty-acid desaturase
LIGLGYIFFGADNLSKLLIAACIIHNAYAIGITAGAHRLWAHKAYQAGFIWKTLIMLLNSGKKINNIFRSKSRVYFSLE